ncbi:MAG: fused MFS/spermidine synthase [Pseudomonadota bacterium]|nr:fused MFS/spermidine synthase [Pseudomonadota bacterium]
MNHTFLPAAVDQPEPLSESAILPGAFQSLQFTAPFVQDSGGSKSLHFTHGELQSMMLTDHPWRLELDYTRTMMGFLLFNPAPRHIGMIGLGGGSLVKFCHRHLKASRMTVLEINPHVIALRHEFQVPDDDERLSVIAADGALFLQTEAPAFDVLLVDGFDHDGQPAALCSQRFYDDCLAALAPGGLLAVNLHYQHPDYPLLVERIERSFAGNAVEVVVEEKTNSIVFASRGPAISPRRLSLQRSLAGLDDEARQQLKPELGRVLWAMKNLDEDGPA